MVRRVNAPKWRATAALCAAPAFMALIVSLAPVTTDPVALFGGIPYDVRPTWLPGFSTIDPNQGFTSYALGVRAALDVLSGRLPLWNPYEGLGSPLLGEVQAAALFPPTLLLLLPHGQLIEQTFLQIVAGLGTFLFLRRFGLGVTGALLGGLLFEFNGVFAWLRNAIYNPVALLPWLFYVVESLLAATIAGRNWRQRGGTIVLGAIAAALALYAGFPEVVFYYCLPLFGWLVLRGAYLTWRQGLAYLGDLTLLGVLTLMLSAPLLLAFVHFLAEGYVGPHRDNGFKDAVIRSEGMIMYLLPYVFGPISYSPIETVAPLWSNGGYLGLTAFILAIGGALTAWRRPVVWLLVFWIVFAVGVTHGAPAFLDVFQRLPLVTVSAFSRYLNAGWLFCAVTLAAIFVDRLPALLFMQRRRVVVAAATLSTIVLAGAVAFAWPALTKAWQPDLGHRSYIVISVMAAMLLLSGAIMAGWGRLPGRAPTALIALATVEALLLFAIPFASSPRRAKLDLPLVQFLQHHAGLQRVAIADGNGLSPNFGSAFGVATINYDDLPVPQRTVDFVQRELEPDVSPIMFRPNASVRQITAVQKRDEFLARVPAYARAGVRYILADADFFSFGPALDSSSMRPIQLAAGQSVTLALQPTPGLAGIAAASIRIATYGGTSNGRLIADICQGEHCQQSSAELGTAIDNASLRIAFTPPFPLTDAPFQLTLSTQGGDHPVALWSKPPALATTARTVGLPQMQDLLPMVALDGGTGPRLVLQTRTSAVFELPDFRPYASAPGCRVEAQSHERMTADCERPARLSRLEVLMNGWTARVNGVAAPVTPLEDTFQAVDLPAGRSVIEFVYAPAGVRPALWLAAATLLGLAVMTIAARRGTDRA
jgi:hypothetical protein